jgi:hypothetical protein
MSNRVLAQSVVDVVREPMLPILGVYKVTVTGVEPHDYVRIYTIMAKSDKDAALEGIDKFVEEFEKA